MNDVAWFLVIVFVLTAPVEKISRWFWRKVGLIKDDDRRDK